MNTNAEMAMREEQRTFDPTRRLLKIFGVKVTDYEERTERIREEISKGSSREDLVRLAAEAVELTSDLNRQLREMNDHVLDAQATVLAEVKGALDRVRERSS